MRVPRLRAALIGLLVLPALATQSASAADGPWQDGKHDEDTVYDCLLDLKPWVDKRA